ncbi:MAG: hypothetical protein J6Q33_00660 [Alistipes sp.]|nr:hypothetical protein [Alistipes sp.]
MYASTAGLFCIHSTSPSRALLTYRHYVRGYNTYYLEIPIFYTNFTMLNYAATAYVETLQPAPI